MSDLEQRLVELGSHMDFPATPPIAAAVRARLAGAPPHLRARKWRLIAAALAAALAVVFGVPPVRTAIAHWLGISGIVIKPVPSLPAATPPRAHQSLTELGYSLGLGQLTSLEAARAQAGFAVAVPTSLGAPDGVYVRTNLGQVVSLLYRPRADLPESPQTGAGLLITEFRGSVETAQFEKLIKFGTVVTPVRVDGGQGYWISTEHAIEYRLPDGSFDTDGLRLTGPALFFERGDVTVRIEGAITEDRALSIAAALR